MVATAVLCIVHHPVVVVRPSALRAAAVASRRSLELEPNGRRRVKARGSVGLQDSGKQLGFDRRELGRLDDMFSLLSCRWSASRCRWMMDGGGAAG